MHSSSLPSTLVHVLQSVCLLLHVHHLRQ
jgi:hypothetical protein